MGESQITRAIGAAVILGGILLAGGIGCAKSELGDYDQMQSDAAREIYDSSPAGARDAGNLSNIISEDLSSLPPEIQAKLSDSSGNQPYVAPQDGGQQPASGKPQHPLKPAASGLVDKTLEQMGLDAARFNSWLVPAAYAQDHGIDEQYLIRSGQCSLEVEEYKVAVVELKRIAAVNGGSVTASESARRSDETLEGWVTLRVPSRNFGAAWDAVLEAGKVLSESTSTEDASQAYVGYVSQLKSLTAEQAVLQKMFDEALAIQRSRGLGDAYKTLLETQERLFAVNAEIQRAEDALSGLTDRITRSTITVSLKETRQLPLQTAQVTEEFDWGLGATAAEAYQVLLTKVRAITQSLLTFAITCWTWLIPWALIIWLAVWIYRRYIKPRLKDVYHAPTSTPTPVH